MNQHPSLNVYHLCTVLAGQLFKYNSRTCTCITIIYNTCTNTILRTKQDMHNTTRRSKTRRIELPPGRTYI